MYAVTVTMLFVDAAADASFPPPPPSSPQGTADTTPQATATSTKGRAPSEAHGGRGIMEESHPLEWRRRESRLVTMAGMLMVSAPLVVKVSGDVVFLMMDVSATVMSMAEGAVWVGGTMVMGSGAAAGMEGTVAVTAVMAVVGTTASASSSRARTPNAPADGPSLTSSFRWTPRGYRIDDRRCNLRWKSANNVVLAVLPSGYLMS